MRPPVAVLQASQGAATLEDVPEQVITLPGTCMSVRALGARKAFWQTLPCSNAAPLITRF